MKSLFYVYASTRETSFREISRFHIFHLSRYVKVQNVDEEVLDVIRWLPGKHVLLHPILYPLVGDRPEHHQQRIKRLNRLLAVSDRLGGFDTADTDRLSQMAVDVLSKFERVFVPSKWAKECYESSGVQSRVEVLPHGLPDCFLSPSRRIDSFRLANLVSLKREHNAIFILFHLLHSGYRKGADLVAKIMKRIQDKYPNVFLLVKRGSNLDPYLGLLRALKLVEIAGWLPADEYRQVFDLADIAIYPSRGGGFEHNALEALSRGLPTLVPKAGCFLDYIDYTIPIEVERWVNVYPDNPIHVGKGFQINLRDFQEKLEDVINHLDDYKERAMKNAYTIRKLYSWECICDLLYKKLKAYKFVD